MRAAPVSPAASVGLVSVCPEPEPTLPTKTHVARTPQKPDSNEASVSCGDTGQVRDARREERREKGVYGAEA